MAFAVGIGEQSHLFDSVDMENMMKVDDILSPYAYEEAFVGRQGMESLFHFGKTEWHHKMSTCDICDMGIMIVSLHIQHAVAVYHIHLVV